MNSKRGWQDARQQQWHSKLVHSAAVQGMRQYTGKGAVHSKKVGRGLHDNHKIVVLLACDIPRIAYVPTRDSTSALVMNDVD